jgi:hypothetical protein
MQLAIGIALALAVLLLIAYRIYTIDKQVKEYIEKEHEL